MARSEAQSVAALLDDRRARIVHGIMREALVKRSSSSNRLQRGLPAPIHRPGLVRIHEHGITFQGTTELQRLASRSSYPVEWLSPSDTLRKAACQK